MSRFENIQVKQSSKKILQCDASTHEYMRNDFLKPHHLPIERVDQIANYSAGSNMQETRFHRGFQRRSKADIQPDAARLEAEVVRDMIREDRARASIEATMEHRERNTFNILTGEGTGRECEFRQVGKKIVNPRGRMENVFPHHAQQASNRVKNSKHRFFETPVNQKLDRTRTLVDEGLAQNERQTTILGYGSSGTRRIRAQSLGVADNYGHLNALPPEPTYEAPFHGNRSQIILG